MVNKYIAVITVVNEMGDTNVECWLDVGVRVPVMLVFIICLADAYTIYQYTSIRLIQI